jgi:hypothetical protein
MVVAEVRKTSLKNAWTRQSTEARKVNMIAKAEKRTVCPTGTRGKILRKLEEISPLGLSKLDSVQRFNRTGIRFKYCRKDRQF